MTKFRVLATAVLTAILALTFAPAASAAPVQVNAFGMIFEYEPGDTAGGLTLVGTYAPVNPALDLTNLAWYPAGGGVYRVTGIADGALQGQGLTSAVLPTTLRWIGDSALADNPLTSLTLRSGLTTIGDEAFLGSQLDSVEIPATVTHIGARAFSAGPGYPDCSGLGAAQLATCLLIAVAADEAASTLTSVKMLGPAPTTGTSPFGAVTDSTPGPMVSYYVRHQASGYTTPTWTTGGADYRTQPLVTITFDGNGYAASPLPVDVPADLWFPISDLPVLSSPSHTHIGWTVHPVLVRFDESSSVRLGQDSTFIAAWQLNEYDVTFVYGNGDPDTIVPTDHGTTVTEPAEDPVYEGHTFTGWELDGSPYDFNAPVTEAITLEAGWLINTYDVTFDPANGGGTTVVPTDHGTTVAEPADDPAYDGHTFTGWELDGSPYDFNTAVTEPITLTAAWNLNTYDVTFQFGNGDADVIVPTDHGLAVVAPPVPTRAGYTFAGWKLEGVDFRMDAAIKRALTLVAAWEDIPAQASAPDTGDEGGQITVTGSGFAPEGDLEVWLNSDPVLLGRFVADPSGAFEVSVAIPSGTPAGEHTLVVTDGVETVEMPFEVIAAPVITEPTRDATADTGADVSLAVTLATTSLLAGAALLVARRRFAV